MTNSTRNFENLKTSKRFELVCKEGTILISRDKKLKANYLLSKDNNQITKIGLSVSSKKGNSVWRNRFRRIIKEALRSYEAKLERITSKIDTGLWIVFSPHILDQTIQRKVFLKDIQPALLDILTKLEDRVILSK